MKKITEQSKLGSIIKEELIAELKERNKPNDGKAAPYGSGYNKIDEDGHMDIPSAIRKCKVIIDGAQDIMEKLGGMSQEQDDLPSWWMDKVTLATDYINKADDYINNSGQINDASITEGRPIPMDTPNEFAYKDFKKYVNQKRSMFKKEMLKHVRKSDGQSDSSRMFRTLSALWFKWAYHKAKDFRHIKDDQKFGRALMGMMVQDNLIFDKNAWKKDNNMTHVKGFKPRAIESVLRGQLAGDSALDMADLLRRYGVKKILKQPNDRVTYLQLNNASQGTKIVAMLKKMFGIKARIDNHMYAPSPAVRFDNDQIAESKLNEMDINDPILVAVRARKTMLDKAKSAPKYKKVSMNQYYKLMDREIDLINQMKAASREFEQLDSDMNQEAGQKGDDWSDADANRYGGDLDKLQTKVETLNAKRQKVRDAIKNYRMS